MNPRIKTFSFIVGPLLLMLLLAGCGGGSNAVNVDLTDTSINLSSNTAKTGNVTFAINNTSTSENHEFVVLQTDLTADQLIKDTSGDVDESKFHSMGEKGDLKPNDKATLTLNLPPGHYAVICNVAGHYDEGMHADFTVTQ